MEDMNWDEAPQYQKDIYEQEVQIWWVVGHREQEQKKRAYFAADPDGALWRWIKDYGDKWNIEIVTTNADAADRIFGLSG